MPATQRPASPAAHPIRIRPEHAPVLAMCGAIILTLSVLAPRAWLVVLYEGLLALVALSAACGWGAWLPAALGLRRLTNVRQFCVSAALGLGVVSTLTLVLGTAGLLTRPTAWALVIAGWLLGLLRLHRAQRPTTTPHGDSRTRSTLTLVSASLVLMIVAVPAAVGLFGAALPPSVLWSGENYAYDVREYHLQVPREYFDAGRIHFLPHNVYASFPQQMEMQYLLLMHLAGDPWKAAVPAQFLHLFCAALAVLTVAAWSPGGWGRVVGAVAVGTVPWVAYLGCLAYVEGGVLLFAAVAAGLVLQQFRDEERAARAKPKDAPPSIPDWSLPLAAGLSAGLAGGCKYTALVLVAAALLAAWLPTMTGTPGLRMRRGVLFTLGVLIAFAPWLIRNAAFTSNPVYPFAYGWFGGRAWSEAQAAQWERGHVVEARRDSLAGRWQITLDELFKSPRFGPALFGLALLGVLVSRTRAATMLLTWFALLVLSWATWTHMPGRFLVPAVIPLGLLAGRAIPRGASLRPGLKQAAIAVAVGVAAVGGVASSATLLRLLDAESTWWSRYEIPLEEMAVHGPRIFRRVADANQIVPPFGRLWMVGDAAPYYIERPLHYTVVFNRDPWLEYAAGAAPAEAVAWLRTANVTHVLFSWAEIERLRGTYGFPAIVTRAWAAQLESAGLKRVDPPPGMPDAPVEIYEVQAE